MTPPPTRVGPRQAWLPETRGGGEGLAGAGKGMDDKEKAVITKGRCQTKLTSWRENRSAPFAETDVM